MAGGGRLRPPPAIRGCESRGLEDSPRYKHDAQASAFSKRVRSPSASVLQARPFVGDSLACASCLYVQSLSVLCFVDVHNRRFQIVVLVDPPATSAFGPEPFPTGMPGFQMTSTPRLELIADRLGMVSGRGVDNMDMVRASLRGMQRPAVDCAMPRHRLFHNLTILRCECECGLFHFRGGHFDKESIRRPDFGLTPTMPTTFVAWQPGSIAGPGDEKGNRIASVKRTVCHDDAFPATGWLGSTNRNPRNRGQLCLTGGGDTPSEQQLKVYPHTSTKRKRVSE